MPTVFTPIRLQGSYHPWSHACWPTASLKPAKRCAKQLNFCQFGSSRTFCFEASRNRHGTRAVHRVSRSTDAAVTRTVYLKIFRYPSLFYQDAICKSWRARPTFVSSQSFRPRLTFHSQPTPCRALLSLLLLFACRPLALSSSLVISYKEGTPPIVPSLLCKREIGSADPPLVIYGMPPSILNGDAKEGNNIQYMSRCMPYADLPTHPPPSTIPHWPIPMPFFCWDSW